MDLSPSLSSPSSSSFADSQRLPNLLNSNSIANQPWLLPMKSNRTTISRSDLFKWKWTLQPYNVLPFIFGIPAIFLNIITLLAILRIRRPLPPNIRLLLSLSSADLLLAIVIVADEAISLSYVGRAEIVNYQKTSLAACGFLFATVTRHSAHIVISLNLTLLALDLYVAIVHPLGYRVSVRYESGIRYAIAAIWFVAISVGYTQVYLPVVPWCDDADSLPFCKRHWECNKILSEIFTLGFLLLCAFPMTTAYLIILIKAQTFLRQTSPCKSKSSSLNLFSFCCQRPASSSQQQQQQQHVQQSNNHSQVSDPNSHGISTLSEGFTIHVSSSIDAQKRRFRRKVRCLITTLTILGVFLICFLPSDFVGLYVLIRNLEIEDTVNEDIVLRYLLNLMLLNSFMDPLIYSWRLKEVQGGYKRLFNCLFKRKPRPTNLLLPAHRHKSFSCSNLHDFHPPPGRQRLTNPIGRGRLPSRLPVITSPAAVSVHYLDVEEDFSPQRCSSEPAVFMPPPLPHGQTAPVTPACYGLFIRSPPPPPKSAAVPRLPFAL